MTGWILCVDDEPKVLEGLELQLGFDYEVRTAVSGPDGLELLTAHRDCATIISDMRMPGMNGAQFLAEARQVSPDSTRMLLTGQSDLDSTIAAINEGGIFRFLSKPVAPETLKTATADAVRQWELVRSERVLLEQTLHGAANALVEALEIASPHAFSRSRRLESAARHVAKELDLPDIWQVALAGMLLRLGWIAIPADIIDKHLARAEIDAEGTAMLEATWATAVRLLSNIPRLDGVVSIIEQAREPSGTVDAPTVVRAVAEYDERCQRGENPSAAIADLAGSFPVEILEALRSWDGGAEEGVPLSVTVHELIEGMIASQDICTTTGNVLVRAGSDMSATTIQRLRNFSTSQGIEQPISVVAPSCVSPQN